MKNLFRSKVTLILVYLMTLGIAVYLNIYSGSIDIPNIIVTGAMFLIVLILFLFSFKKFRLIDAMIDDFNDAASEIRNDFRVNDDGFLWRYYRGKDNLFTNHVLAGRYAEYKSEVDRMEQLSGDIYRCDIEDYINQDTIDAAIRRNVLNLVAGTMTGLGILGTFIGLTIGLQHFNTGTADEISMSISPLIQGIKVAFYTSIYGMVFSLIYSFIYRNKTEDVYKAMDRFLDAYKGCVLPDTKGEGMRQLLEFEKKQAESLMKFASQFGAEVGNHIAKIVTPEFERMNQTIEAFASVATRSQVEGIERVVDRFVELMNRSLGNCMQELKNCIMETVTCQKEDREYMKRLLREISDMAADVAAMNDLSVRTIRSTASYVERLDHLEAALNESIEMLQSKMRENSELVTKQQSYVRNMAAYEQKLSASAETIALKLNEASDQFGANYKEALTDTTDSFERMQHELESMIYSVDSLRRNINALKELKNS